MRNQITWLVILCAIPFLYCGCGNDPNSLRETCASMFSGDQDFDTAIVAFEELRDSGVTKEQVLFLVAIPVGCAQENLPPNATTQGCEDCFRGLIDLVWGS